MTAWWDEHQLGMGGHINGGEEFATGMYRELKEEVGLTPGTIFCITNSLGISTIRWTM